MSKDINQTLWAGYVRCRCAKGKEDAMRESFFAGMQQGVKLLLMLIDMPIG